MFVRNAIPGGGFLARTALALAAATLLCLPGRGISQDTPKEVRAQAMSALAIGAYEDAIPPLRQLIEWFGESPKESTKAEMEEIFYSLGLCHMFLAQWNDARSTYNIYLKKYKFGSHAGLVYIFLADCWRFEQKYAEAVKAYEVAVKSHDYDTDLRTDILCCIARCFLAEERWADAAPILIEIYRLAPDPWRKNWAAAMLGTSYLKDLDVNKVYPMMPLLLQPDSFASRSVALNMTALTAGDELFADERFRDALWIYRMVYPHDTLVLNCQTQLERAQRRVQRLKRTPGLPRELMRAQEIVSEIENELQALEKIPNYDPELFYRIARSYMETRRVRESGEMFYHLYLEGLQEKKEENLYLSIICAAKIKPADLSLARGLEYLQKFEGGKYYDTVSLMVGQIYANQQNWPKVLLTLGKALTVHPKHENIVEVLFLLGYASFMEEKLTDAQQYFVRINTEFPGNEREADAAYWAGMSFLFDKNYEEGRKYFDRVIHDFPECAFVEDASFRSPTCDFGLSQYYDAERKLLAFVEKFPQSKLMGEAHVMLGDVSGAVGELEEAVRRYRKGIEFELNVELYNHACFRCGEMLRELKDWQGAVKFFTDYIQRAKPDSNIPLAIFWIGDAYWEMGQPESTFRYFGDALTRYGNDRKELGIDLILEKWVDRTRQAPKPLAQKAWLDMREMLKQALAAKTYTLALRMERILMYDPAASDVEKAAMRKFMLRAENLAYASPGVLEMMIDESVKAGNPALAKQAAEAIIREFTETDYALSARRLLAQQALDAKDWDGAIVHLNIIREVYASSDDAADALLTLGRLYREKEQYDKADAAYKDVVGVKEWKPRWPEALYGRGEVARAQRKWDQAAAYFERIYVLYTGAKDWSAKAYLARAECLGRLLMHAKAVETLDEMLNNPQLQGTPEAEQAKELRDKMKARM